MELKCCICGKEFDGYGNNANPIKDGTCCDECNFAFVVPARIHVYKSRQGFINYTVCPSKAVFDTNNNLLINHGFRHDKDIGSMQSFYNEETDEEVILVPGYSVK